MITLIVDFHLRLHAPYQRLRIMVSDWNGTKLAGSVAQVKTLSTPPS